MAPKIRRSPAPVLVNAAADMPANALAIGGGALRENTFWHASTVQVGGDSFVTIRGDDNNLSRFLTGRITVPGRKERILSHIRVLARLKDARDAMVRCAATEIEQELQAEMQDQSAPARGPALAKTKAREKNRKSLHRSAQYGMLPEALVVEARLSHDPLRPLRCKVLKDKATAPVRMQITEEILSVLHKEIRDLAHSYCRFLRLLEYCPALLYIFCASRDRNLKLQGGDLTL